MHVHYDIPEDSVNSYLLMFLCFKRMFNFYLSHSNDSVKFEVVQPRLSR